MSTSLNPWDIIHPDQRTPSKCYLTDELRRVVHTWRQQQYPGITTTSRRLLQFWFDEDHRVNDEFFCFWFAQREAIETLVYVYEVAKKRRFMELAREFGHGPIGLYDPSIDQYPLYGFKMATGAGKTLVMAIAVVWSYFNHLKENADDYGSKFLLITPNLIVYDRLKRDFEGGRIFRDLPLIPPEWLEEWNVSVILNEDLIGTIPESVLFLTNIQKLEERDKGEESEVGEFLGVKPVEKLKPVDRIREVLSSCPNIVILKDEAHHIYDVEKSWKNILIKLDKRLAHEHGKGINMELDFSATPKTKTGAYFYWILVDFTLKEAIEMSIVKRPLKGVLRKAREVSSSSAHERYRAWIDAGVRRWREYRTVLEKLDKKPTLFIMCEDTTAANDVYDYLNSTPDLKDKILLIHTNLQGDVIQKDLDTARKAVRNIDERTNPYDAVVSVMMLNEGWDVRSVTTIVGLRSYTSKRKVLPEQVIGRGLRKMFLDQAADPKTSVNVLEVIGPPGLVDVLSELEKQEGIKLPTFDVTRPINMVTIYVDEQKLQHSFTIPILSPRIRNRQLNLGEFNLADLSKMRIKLENKVLKTTYVAVDMLKDIVVVEREWALPVPEDSKSVIAYYTDKILQELRLPKSTNFEAVYPLVKEYVINMLFEKQVSLDDPRVLYTLSEPAIEQVLINLFVKSLRKLIFAEEEPKLEDHIDLKQISPFVWTKQVYPADKCVLNFAPCDSEFEVRFCKFLDEANDVRSFIKNAPRVHFDLEYQSVSGVVKRYIPDYVILTTNKENVLLETKGIEDPDVRRKDERARIWCKDVTDITGKKWIYVRIDQDLFEARSYETIRRLIDTARNTVS